MLGSKAGGITTARKSRLAVGAAKVSMKLRAHAVINIGLVTRLGSLTPLRALARRVACALHASLALAVPALCFPWSALRSLTGRCWGLSFNVRKGLS